MGRHVNLQHKFSCKVPNLFQVLTYNNFLTLEQARHFVKTQVINGLVVTTCIEEVTFQAFPPLQVCRKSKVSLNLQTHVNQQPKVVLC
jgi:hypothetical protein